MKESLLNPQLKLKGSKQPKFILSNSKQPFKLKHKVKPTEKPLTTSFSEKSNFNSKLSLRKQSTLSTTKVAHLSKDKTNLSLLPKLQINLENNYHKVLLLHNLLY